jgi:hypothetical protein
MSLNETWRCERGIVRRQIVIDCGIYDPEKLDQICAVVAAHDGALDADLSTRSRHTKDYEPCDTH